MAMGAGTSVPLPLGHSQAGEEEAAAAAASAAEAGAALRAAPAAAAAAAVEAHAAHTGSGSAAAAAAGGERYEEELVRRLSSGSTADQNKAAVELACWEGATLAAFAATQVQRLSSKASKVQHQAAAALGALADGGPCNKAAIMHAKGAEALVKLLRGLREAAAAGAASSDNSSGGGDSGSTTATAPSSSNSSGGGGSGSTAAAASTQAALALSKLADRSPSSRQAIVKAGGVEELVKLLDMGSSTAPQQAAAARALSRLAEDRTCFREHALTCMAHIRSVLTLARSAIAGSSAQLPAAAAPYAEQPQSDGHKAGKEQSQSDGCKQAIARAHAIPALVRLLGSSSTDVQSAAAWALAHLAEEPFPHDDGRNTQPANPLVVVARVATHFQSRVITFVLNRSMSTAQSTDDSPSNPRKQAIADEGGIPALVGLLSSNSVPVQHAAAAALARLADDGMYSLHPEADSPSDRYKAEIVEAGGIEALKRLLRTADPDVDEEAAKVEEEAATVLGCIPEYAQAYVRVGRWVNLIFYAFIELCYSNGVHPFTGDALPGGAGAFRAAVDRINTADPQGIRDFKGCGSLSGDSLAKQGSSTTEASGSPSGDGTTVGAPDASRSGKAKISTQRCFLDACDSTRARLIQEQQSLMLVTVLLATVAVTLILPLAAKTSIWSLADYVVCVFVLLTFAFSFAQLAMGACLCVMSSGRTPRAFMRLLLMFEKVADFSFESFFLALLYLFVATIIYTCAAALSVPSPNTVTVSNAHSTAGRTLQAVHPAGSQAGVGAGTVPTAAGKLQVPVYAMPLIVAFTVFSSAFFASWFLFSNFLVRFQRRYEKRGRWVHRDALLHLESFLCWDFMAQTNPFMAKERSQSTRWHPMRAYAKQNGYTEDYMAMKLNPIPLNKPPRRWRGFRRFIKSTLPHTFVSVPNFKLVFGRVRRPQRQGLTIDDSEYSRPFKLKGD